MFRSFDPGSIKVHRGSNLEDPTNKYMTYSPPGAKGLSKYMSTNEDVHTPIPIQRESLDI